MHFYPPSGSHALCDLAYGPHEAQKLNLYLPPSEAAKETPRPLVVWIHGGAWIEGDKSDCLSVGVLELLHHGFAVASLNYRLSQQAIFPAQIHDCKGALRWLRAQSKEFNIDPLRFGAWGASAGGHLVALLGTSGGIEELEGDVGGHLEQSSRVQAVCDWFGSSDLSKLSAGPTDWDHDASDSPASRLLGSPLLESRAKADRANPIAYINGDEPPFLIMHGDRDRILPLIQSELLHSALHQAGAVSELRVIEGAGHGFDIEQVLPSVVAFFAKHL